MSDISVLFLGFLSLEPETIMRVRLSLSRPDYFRFKQFTLLACNYTVNFVYCILVACMIAFSYFSEVSRSDKKT